ncbi:hypothetical protein [Arcobacter arenosus]|uniref:hypothetical protein n=1 Tax=Arcobacter arenosus TaxID=2576037 RepID=UPI003BAD0502
MSKVDIENYTSDEITSEQLGTLIENKKSFKIVAVKDIGFMVNKIEGAIEKRDLSCRVYTEYRSVAMGAVAIPTPVTVLGGLATMVGTAAHNLATFNPDYEIGKNKIKSTVTVIYQKD